MAQDNEIKKAVIVGSPENAAGNESGVTTLIPNAAPSTTGPTGNDGINGTASQENLSAKYKYPRVSEDVPVAGKNQYE